MLMPAAVCQSTKLLKKFLTDFYDIFRDLLHNFRFQWQCEIRNWHDPDQKEKVSARVYALLVPMGCLVVFSINTHSNNIGRIYYKTCTMIMWLSTTVYRKLQNDNTEHPKPSYNVLLTPYFEAKRWHHGSQNCQHSQCYGTLWPL